MEFIAEIFKIGFDAYQIESPYFGLTYWDIAVGVFFISISLGVFKTLFTMKINGHSKGWRDKEYKTKNDN